MQLSIFRPLYDLPGPWASVYLDASRDSEDAAKTVELHWRAARESLAAAGCDDATLEALGTALLTHPVQPGRYSLAGFAAGGSAAMCGPLNGPLSAPPVRTPAAWGPLPHVMPMVAHLGNQIPYVRVVVDHTGGVIEAAADVGRLVRSETVTGSEDFPIRKVQIGGWSQSRFQRAADETWRRNAGDVAAAVVELAESCAAEIVVVAGDPRSRPMLVGHLPPRWAERVVEAGAGARAAGADPAALQDATLRAVAEHAAGREQEIIDRFRSQRGRDAAAGNGLPAVVTGLQRGQVDTVLLVDEPRSTTRLWVGPGPLDLSFDRDELLAMRVADPQPARADAALIRALACTEGNLVLVDPHQVELDGGVAALLRYADVGTRHR